MFPTDKAAKNFAFICRHHYQKVLYDEHNSNNGAYADCDLNRMNIFDTFQGELYKGWRRVPPYITKEIDSISDKAAKTGRCVDLFNLPLMYWIPKMPKKVPKARSIAGSANVLTIRLARVVNVLLSQVKNFKRCTNSMLQLCLVITNIKDTGQMPGWYNNKGT